MARTSSVLLLLLGAIGCVPEAEPASPAPVLDVRAAGSFSLATPVSGATAEEAARLLLGDPPDLRVTSVRRSLTGEHVRFVPLAADGTPIARAEIAVHLEGSAPSYLARLVRSNVARPVVLSGSRTLDATAAAARAIDAALVLDASATARPFRSEPVAVPVGGGGVRAGWRVVVTTEDPPHEWEVWVDGETGEAWVRRDLLVRVDGTGYVFMPNPVTSSGDDTLVDNNDADSPVLTADRVSVTMRGLDGSGYLRGEWADVENLRSRAQVSSLAFDFTRSADEFEEVNAYYHVDRVQRHVQSLGFTGARGIQALPFHVLVNAMRDDNSWFDGARNEIKMGDGGVDDAEDGDVVAHEYGHALQDGIVSGFGTSFDAGAIGEGFSDLIAGLTPTGGPDLIPRTCIAPWDSTAYMPPPPPTPCLRHIDGQKHYPEFADGEVHDDGEIWSGAMYDAVNTAGLGSTDGLQLLLEAFFLFSPDETFAASAQAVIQTDVSMHDGAHQAVLRRVLTWHGLLADIQPPADFSGTSERCPYTLASTNPILDLHDEHVNVVLPGAQAIRVHFASFDMEEDRSCLDSHCDNVYLYDGEGRLYAKLGGPLGASDAPAVPGSTVVIRWVSDGSVNSPGFSIDYLEVIPTVPGQGCAAAPPDAAPPPPTPDGAPGTEVDAAPGANGDGGGCGCRTAGGNARARGAAGLLLLALAFLSRRRRAA